MLNNLVHHNNGNGNGIYCFYPSFVGIGVPVVLY